MSNSNSDRDGKGLSRRHFLGAGLLGAAGFLTPSFMGHAHAARVGLPRSGTFKVAFRNSHTGDSFSGVYRVGSRYLPEAFEEINYVLRDFRTGEVFPIDPRVIDIIYSVRSKIETDKPFHVLSGYRSPKTNNMLRSNSTGVARNSLHLTGQAVDLRLPGYKTTYVRDVAKSLRAGGVGYYSRSDFVHMDTGKVRYW